MARTKQGVFSWEDVLAQRYQSEYPATSTFSNQDLETQNSLVTRQATNHLHYHGLAVEYPIPPNSNPNAIFYPTYRLSSGSSSGNTSWAVSAYTSSSVAVSDSGM